MPVNKVRRNGSYAPLSAQAYKDDALAEAGEAAELLFYRGLSFSADVLRDGFISDTQLARFVGVGMRDATRRAARLVEVGLWTREDAGYQITNWLKYNASREEIDDRLRKDSARKGDAALALSPTESERNPNGIRTESDADAPGNPDGIQPRAVARGRSLSLSLRNASSSAVAEPAPGTPNAGVVVGAWVEAMAEHGTTPTSGMRGQVGRLARELLEKHDPVVVLEAARAAGRKGYATIDRELAALNGRTRAGTTGGQAPDGRRWEQ